MSPFSSFLYYHKASHNHWSSSSGNRTYSFKVVRSKQGQNGSCRISGFILAPPSMRDMRLLPFLSKCILLPVTSPPGPLQTDWSLMTCTDPKYHFAVFQSWFSLPDMSCPRPYCIAGHFHALEKCWSLSQTLCF